MTVTVGARARLPLFLSLSVLMVLVGQAIVASPQFATRAILPAALTLDFLLWIPLFYWLLLVRGVGWPKLTVIPITLASVALAQWVIPPAQQGALDKVHLILVPLELGILLYIITKAVRAVRRLRSNIRGDADVWAVLRQTARSSIPFARLADAAAFEIAVFYYALFSWKVTRKNTTPGYSLHRNSGYGLTVLVLLGVVAVETVVVHLLLTDVAGVIVAWLVSLLSIYGAFWLIADYQAIRIRTIRLGENSMQLRCGFRWDVEVAYNNVERLEPYRQSQLVKERVELIPFGAPAFLLHLREPVDAVGVYGMRRSVQQIGFTVDDMPALQKHLEEYLDEGPRET
jgi:hypothetical protein